MDLTDDSLKGTPRRVAKMFVNEIFSGLHPDNKPESSTFQNKYKYGEMLVEKTSPFTLPEHHLLPIVGKAHVAYISNGTVVGLSKMNRIVDYFAKRPQVQERLTLQIVEELQNILNTKNVACVIDAKHLCVNSRGIRDITSSTVTSEFGGRFNERKSRESFGLFKTRNSVLIDNSLVVLNSLSGEKEAFKPINPGYVGMYVCGPTVYSNVHLGNCRTFISFDLIYRYLKHLGYKVRYVRNITDAGHLENDEDTGEDRIAKKAKLKKLNRWKWFSITQ